MPANPNVNFGIHQRKPRSVVNVNMLLHSTYEKYTLLASSNDILINENAVSCMVHFLEMNDDYDLVYGRNIRDGNYAEPWEHCFSVPGLKIQHRLGYRTIIAWILRLGCIHHEPLWASIALLH